MRIIVSGGGTGGHIYPALALIDRLKERDLLDDVLYVARTAGWRIGSCQITESPLKPLKLRLSAQAQLGRLKVQCAHDSVVPQECGRGQKDFAAV